MNNFIFKSASRLTKNSSITLGAVIFKLEVMQKQLRDARQDNLDLKLMLNKLLVNEHLKLQVDDYFDKHDQNPEDNSQGI